MFGEHFNNAAPLASRGVSTAFDRLKEFGPKFAHTAPGPKRGKRPHNRRVFYRWPKRVGQNSASFGQVILSWAMQNPRATNVQFLCALRKLPDSVPSQFFNSIWLNSHMRKIEHAKYG